MVGSYKIFFWSDENNEPVHIHITKKKPSPHATKIWLTKNGGCIVAHNKERIPEQDLNELLEIIQAQYFLICSEWKKHFKTEEIQFYC
jgi:hypothetical protein